VAIANTSYHPASAGAGAGTDEAYITVATDGDLSNERALAAESGVLTITDGGANGNITIGVATDGITNAKLRNSGALSVIGRSANSAGDPADISATAASGAVLRESGSAIGFGTISTDGYADNSVTYAKMQDVSATDRLIGRDTAGAGDPEEISVGGGLEFTGSGGIRRSALTGDVTAAAGSGSTTIANDAVTTAKILDDNVTYAKIQNVSATDRILGRDTAGAGDIEELTVGGGLEFTGGGGIQRSALTGDVTATAGSNATTIANNAVTNAMIRDSAALSVIGRSANSAGDPADIAGTDGQVLRVSGTTLGFGQVATAGIADDAITADKLGILTTKGDLITYTTLPARLAAGTDGHVLTADSSQAAGIKWAAAAASGGGARDRYWAGTQGGDQYYRIAGLNGNRTLAAGAMTTGRLYALPFFTGSDTVTITKLTIYVSTLAASGVARLGIYSPTSTTNMAPSALVVDSGEFATTTTGKKQQTVSAALSANTLYWAVAIFGTAAPSVAAMDSTNHADAMIAIGNNLLNATNTVQIGFYRSVAYGALPDPFGSATIFSFADIDPIPAIGVAP